jgi:YVTN family beta-propeller protein
VSVIDRASGAVVKAVFVGKDPTSVGISPDGNEAFVANLDDGTVFVIDVASKEVSAASPVGGDPNGAVVFADQAPPAGRHEQQRQRGHLHGHH